MPGIAKWATPQPWADAFNPADFNALANQAGKGSTATPVNNAGGFPFLDLSFRMVTSTMTPQIGGGLDFYILPLLHDDVTYPDHEDTSVAANLPSFSYFVGRMTFRSKATQVQNGMLRGIIAPNGTFKFYVINKTGAALPSNAVNMTCKYRLYGTNLNG
jgi:hypothetical protein